MTGEGVGLQIEAGGWVKMGGGHQCMRITAFRASDEIQITSACTKCPGKLSAFHNIPAKHCKTFARAPCGGLRLVRFHSLC